MRKMITLLLFVPCFALAQTKGVELGKKYTIEGTMCLSEEAAVKIAEAYAHGGPASERKIYEYYARLHHSGKNGGCVHARTAATLLVMTRRVEGKFGVVRVYRGIMELGNVSFYMPISSAAYPKGCDLQFVDRCA